MNQNRKLHLLLASPLHETSEGFQKAAQLCDQCLRWETVKCCSFRRLSSDPRQENCTACVLRKDCGKDMADMNKQLEDKHHPEYHSTIVRRRQIALDHTRAIGLASGFSRQLIPGAHQEPYCSAIIFYYCFMLHQRFKMIFMFPLAKFQKNGD